MVYGGINPLTPAIAVMDWNFGLVDSFWPGGGLSIGSTNSLAFATNPVAPGCLVVQSNVTALTFTGNGAGLTGIAVAGVSNLSATLAPLASTGFVNTATAPLASTGFVNAATAPLASTGFVNAATAPLANTNQLLSLIHI